jgi:hypothetical protein
MNQFVDRPAAMAELERVLLPKHEHDHQQQIQVLYEIEVISKAQLAVEFARRHHRQFSAVFWPGGRSEDSLKGSIACDTSRAISTWTKLG